MTDNNEVQLFKVCPFEDVLNVTKTYVCYRNEVCCSQGCCSVFTYKYFQNWQFWIIALLIFICFYLLGKYCKKLEKQRLAMQCNAGLGGGAAGRLPPRAARFSAATRDSSSTGGGGGGGGGSARSGGSRGNVGNLLEHFIYQYNQARCPQCPAPKDAPSGEPPPLYNDALDMPRPEPKPTAACILSSECETDKKDAPLRSSAAAATACPLEETVAAEENVPSYEDATRHGRAPEAGTSDVTGEDRRRAKTPQNRPQSHQ